MKKPSVYEIAGEKVHLLHVTGEADETSDLLRFVADLLDLAGGTVLIGIQNTGFGEAWETSLQVTYTTEGRE